MKIKIPQPTTIDFETFRIDGRPMYPPVPVGVSIKRWGKKPRYYAWGHVGGGNNCTLAAAKAALQEVWHTPDGLLFHHAKFDLDVAEVHMRLKAPAWDRTHDTVFLLYLDDPHSRQLGLKPSAHRLLGMPPEERDAVADWLVERQPVPGVRIGRGESSKHPPGAYIAYAPGDVVAPYADGDTARTEALFRLLWEKTRDRGMMASYDRERRLMPCLLDMERRGVPVDVPRLRADVEAYAAVRDRLEAWLRHRAGIGPDVNMRAPEQVLKALLAAGLADESLMGQTPTGKTSMNKASLEAGVSDRQVGATLRYLAALNTCLGTFMEPWLAVAEASGGFIFTTWNQTKGGAKGGTRSGRLSSSPNFQNIPKEFAPLFAHEAGSIADPDERKRFLKTAPKWPIAMTHYKALPLCRGYIVPFPGHVLVDRDYSQQEPRILAHFEDGALKEQYLTDPWIDYHDNARDHLERIFNKKYKRRPVKNINLGIIYGEGVGSLAAKNGETVEATKELRDAIYALYPGLRDMYRDMKQRAKMDVPIRTWGGREYYCEKPIISNGRFITFDYKMLNTLIQGSAADCTKEAIIRYYDVKPANHFLLLQVHDQLVGSVPAGEIVAAHEQMRQAMESVEFDVQILTEGDWSAENWNAMRTYDKKGKRVAANDDLPPQGAVRKARARQ